MPRAAALARWLTRATRSLAAQTLWSERLGARSLALVHWDVKPANILWASGKASRDGEGHGEGLGGDAQSDEQRYNHYNDVDGHVEAGKETEADDGECYDFIGESEIGRAHV